MLYLLQTVDYIFYVMFRDAVMSNVAPFLPISQFFFHADFPSPVVERFADGLHWWVYLSFSPLHLASLLFSAICNASSDNHFALLHLFFCLSASWEICLQVKKQQLELDMEQKTGFKLGKKWSRLYIAILLI